MLHVALKIAPGSTESFQTNTSPLILAELRRVSSLDTLRFPVKLPAISAFSQERFPLTTPFFPSTTLEGVVTVPSTKPSILKNPLEVMSPLR